MRRKSKIEDLKKPRESQNRTKIATCHTCHWSIYRGDLVHYSSTGNRNSQGVSQHVGGGTTFHSSSGTSHYERWVQCDWCLNETYKELARYKAWENKWSSIIWLGVGGITFLGFLIFFDLEAVWKKNEDEWLCFFLSFLVQ